ncbi:hypothetical protein D0Z00_000910 [Geotrichum galactomycetum]|uniref:Uncharacterized protein n=1 Tax=Geotrichum galactomycetum TaxID=27317 RepID=A0ACB6V8N9_9ASCO|nr:hypothetical protein D0Z00_000910 [Geotrichum candidum]
MVHLHEYFDLSKNVESSRINSFAKDRFSAFGNVTDYDNESIDQFKPAGLKSKPPPIPALRLGNEVPTVPNEPLVDDIVAVINEWYNTYVYHHYLFGNFELVNTINTIIQDLYFIRRKLIYGLLTSNERILARKKVIWQIARVVNVLNRGHVVRDTKTGEILAGKEGPVRLAQEQILTALAPNYPDHSMINDVHAEVTKPKHILVDFKSCIGQGYGHGLTVYFQLRTKSAFITEPFAIKIKPDMRITDLNAVLFRDLPLSVIRGDVILNAEVFEDVPLKSKTPTSLTNIFNSSNVPVSNVASKKQGRRGLASGAADISRLFRIEDKGESPFTIRMYATYFSVNEPNKDNRGWGELFERIVRGRPNGVVKNIEHLQNQGSHSAIGMARSLYTTALTDDRDDLFITLGKISLAHITGPIADYLLVSLGTSTGKALFSNASNTKSSTSWDSLATYNNEVVGEMVKVNKFDKNDNISFSLYVGGEFVAQTNIPIWHGTKVWSGKRTVNFTRENDIVATLNITVNFVGNGYNTDIAIEKIIHWRVVYDAHGIDELISTLAKFKVIDSTEFVKRFHEIMDALLEMLSTFIHSERDDLLLNIFYALINTLEKVTARNKDYLYLANDYLNNRFNFPGLAEPLLTLTDQAIQIDTSPGHDHDLLKRMFKVFGFLSRLLAASAAIDSDRGREAQQLILMTVRKYLRRTTDTIKTILGRKQPDFYDLQLVIVQNIFEFYENIRVYVPPDDMLQMIIELTDSIRNDDDKINTQRLLLIKKISNSWHYNQSKYRPHITAYTIKWTLPFWLASSEFTPERKDQIRLLSGIFSAQFNILWPVREKEIDVCKRYGQLLPVGAKIYNELLNQFEVSGKKRTRKVFSPLFSDTYPFETRPIDSLKTAVHILHSMIISEWTLNEDLSGLQREILASLDDIFQSRAFLPEEYDKVSFCQLLRSSIRVDREDEAFPYINALLEDVEEFLDLLLDLYNVPPGDAYNDDRIFHALNILNFLKDIDRVEIFSRYVNDIAEWNRSKGNYVQTGLALRLLASAYEWSYEQRLEASEIPSFPAQTGFERKEALYEDIIQCFTKGKSFENAIDAVKELIHVYETISFDFQKLSTATRALAKLYESVDTVERLSPQYFRVAYIGVGFPRSLRNRLFIFEGNAYEKLESIHDRLRKTYPGATIVSNESAAKQDGQYLFVTTVDPDISGKLSHLKQIRPTPGAKEYYSRLNLRYFTYSKPLPGNTSPLDLWVEKTTYETYQALPTIVKRSEVKAVNVVKLSPLENALTLLQMKTNDLLDLEAIINSGKADQSVISKLDLILSGAVDSPVNGGIQLFRAFLEDNNLRNDPSTSLLVSELEMCFLDYASVIQRSLVIHGKVVPATLLPLHQSLVELFKRNFAPELATLSDGISYEEQLNSGLLMRQGSITNAYGYVKPKPQPIAGSRLNMNHDYDEDIESKANLDSLLGNAIAASDILMRGPGDSGNGLRNDRTSIMMIKQNRSESRALFR